MKITPLIALLAFSAPGLHAATLIGDVVTIHREIPSIGFNSGLVNTLVVAGTGDLTPVSGGNNMSVNPEENSIIFVLGPNGGFGGGFPDHRIVVEDIDWIGDPEMTIQSIAASSAIPGFNSSMVSFTGDSITLNVGALSWSGGETVTVALNPVPEAGSSMLALTGAAGLLLRRRRRG